MADLFGEWVPQEWIDAVLDVVSATPQWTYIFLTKNPKRLPTIEWPENAWVGATVDTLARVLPTQEAFASLGARVCFVSVEPMREPVTFTNYDLFDWVIIGGQSQSSGEPARQPEFWWVHELTDQAHLAGCKVFWKPNLAARPEEYPVSP
jgi:protein gp37